jgi:hypothetical protein
VQPTAEQRQTPMISMFSVLKESWIFEAVDGNMYKKHIHHHVNFYWKALLLPMLTKATALFYESFVF